MGPRTARAGRATTWTQWALATLAAGGCGSPTGSSAPGPDSPAGPAITVLEISGPQTLLVHQAALLSVSGRSEGGELVPLTDSPRFESSDPNVLSISSSGVVRAEGRGTATITARTGSASGSLSVHVRARVVLSPAYSQSWPDYWLLAVGDQLAFTAGLADVDGNPLKGTIETSWTSSDPGVVSVNAAGVVTALEALQSATVSATTSDGSASVAIVVDSVLAGQPTTIRLAHAAWGLGPLTFVSNRHDPVTLPYGEAADVEVGSGLLLVETEGFPGTSLRYPGATSFAGMLRPGDVLALYAVDLGSLAWLTPAWGGGTAVPADSGLVRLIQGSGYPVVTFSSADGTIDLAPALCYFDPGDPSPYFSLAAGPFDLVLQKKYGDTDSARLAAEAPFGGSVTLVLTGSSPATAGFLAFDR